MGEGEHLGGEGQHLCFDIQQQHLSVYIYIYIKIILHKYFVFKIINMLAAC